MQLVFLILMYWIPMFPVDSTVQLMNNKGQTVSVYYTTLLLVWKFLLRQEIVNHLSHKLWSDLTLQMQVKKSCKCFKIQKCEKGLGKIIFRWILKIKILFIACTLTALNITAIQIEHQKRHMYLRVPNTYITTHLYNNASILCMFWHVKLPHKW